MFENVGKKIKNLAIIICVVNIVLSILTALIVCNNIKKDFIVVLFIFIGIVGLGILFAWLSTIYTYAFGQLVDNSDTIVSILSSTICDPDQDMKKIFNKDFFYDENSPIDTNESKNNFGSNSDEKLYVPNDL